MENLKAYFLASEDGTAILHDGSLLCRTDEGELFSVQLKHVEDTVGPLIVCVGEKMYELKLDEFVATGDDIIVNDEVTIGNDVSGENCDEMAADEMAADEMAADEMVADEMVADEMAVDETVPEPENDEPADTVPEEPGDVTGENCDKTVPENDEPVNTVPERPGEDKIREFIRHFKDLNGHEAVKKYSSRKLLWRRLARQMAQSGESMQPKHVARLYQKMEAQYEKLTFVTDTGNGGHNIPLSSYGNLLRSMFLTKTTHRPVATIGTSGLHIHKQINRKAGQTDGKSVSRSITVDEIWKNTDKSTAEIDLIVEEKRKALSDLRDFHQTTQRTMEDSLLEKKLKNDALDDYLSWCP